MSAVKLMQGSKYYLVSLSGHLSSILLVFFIEQYCSEEKLKLERSVSIIEAPYGVLLSSTPLAWVALNHMHICLQVSFLSLRSGAAQSLYCHGYGWSARRIAITIRYNLNCWLSV